MLPRFAVFLVVIGICCGTQIHEDFDELNSPTRFANKVLSFLDHKNSEISEKCNNHWKEYANGLKKKNRIWALKMFDASSKIPSGVLQGNFVDLGFFDECLDVEGSSLSSLPIETIYGKYCIGTLPIRSLINTTQYQLPVFDSNLIEPKVGVPTPDKKKGLQFGICIPNACSAAEVGNIFAGIGINMAFHDDLCQIKSDQPELDSGAIAALSFLGVIFCIILCSTVYEAILYYYYHSEKEPAHPILTAFSIITNGKKVLATSNSRSQISCLHGIRVISTMWVIIGHRYAYQLNFPVRNFFDVPQFLQNRLNCFIINAQLSVDTFFLLSGLVLSYVYMCSVSKGIKFNIITFYVHRYVRLTPVLAVIALIHATLIKYFGSGPIYPSTVNHLLVNGCERYWWKTLLYVQYGSNCVSQTWYICVDTQLYLLSPIILIPLKKWPKLALSTTGILTVCSMLAGFLTGWFMELRTNTGANHGQAAEDYTQWYYISPHTRAAPWLIGIVLGYYIFQVKQGKLRVKLNMGLMLALWIVSIGVLCTCVFTGIDLFNERQYDKVANSLHMALVRPAWAVGVGWIIFACVIGYGGPVNWFLSLPVFQVLSKFTYTLYLLHLQIIIIIAAQMRFPPIYSSERMMYVFWGDFAFSLALAVVFTLAFESPIINIEQIVFGKAKRNGIKSLQPPEAKHAEKSTEPA